jgi:hypothetical protein
MKRVYLLMALFGFGAALIVVFAPYFLSSDPSFSLQYGAGPVSFLRYYLLSLTFFVVLAAAAEMKTKSAHGDQPARRLGISLVCFSVGSWLAIAAFFVLLGAAFKGINPTL